MRNLRWFKYRFKPDVYAKLLKNGAYNGAYHLDNAEFKDPEELVSCLFIWSRTPEGFEYWHSIYEKFRLRELARRARAGNKTVINHLMSLPKKYRKLAIRNFIKMGDPHSKFWTCYKYPITALIDAFNWTSSPEGWDFWNKAYDDTHAAYKVN